MTNDLRMEAGGISPDAFRRAGHELVDFLADFLTDIDKFPVTPNPDQDHVRTLLGPDRLLESPVPLDHILRKTAEQLIHNSLHNGHPRFWAYITSSADPVGMLADLLASAMNPNVAIWHLAPLATEIELQVIRWIADLIGYPRDCGGILVSGGNMANFVCFLAARRAKADWQIDREGLRGGPDLALYVSTEAHTWVDKAADLFGLGADRGRWIGVDGDLCMRTDLLERAIADDRRNGLQPFMVVGTAGTVSTGAIDPLDRIAEVCRREELWFHVDGAYGGPAASLPEATESLKALSGADSIALDPHKWLYAPLEAGCALVRNLQDLDRAFSHKPFYLMTGDEGVEQPPLLVDRGPQNSRGFRALKVWLGLQVRGKARIVSSIAEDIALSRHMAECLRAHSEIEVTSQSLSITTFRYVPSDIDSTMDAKYLDALNERLLRRLQAEGNVFPSQANVGGRYVLRACIVNFRTTARDVEALPALMLDAGAAVHAERSQWWSES